jgi:hypothetical protein
MTESGGKSPMTTYAIHFCPDCGRRSDETPRMPCSCAPDFDAGSAQEDATAALSPERTRGIVNGPGK